MSRPDSLITMLRRVLAQAIDPQPPLGKAWCILCPDLGGERTAEMPAEEIFAHLRMHKDQGQHVRISMRQSSKSRDQ